MSATSFMIAFIRKEEIAKDTYCYFFDSTKSEMMFTAGQYMQIILPHKNVDDRGISRFFTISSSPTERQFFITTRNGQSSFKQTLSALTEGTLVHFFGPIGTFVLPLD